MWNQTILMTKTMMERIEVAYELVCEIIYYFCEITE